MKAPKLNLICSKDELRPAMCNVYINKDHAVATNGMSLVRYSRAFIDALITKLPAEVYIPAKEWAKLTKPYVVAVYENEVIKVTGKKGSTQLISTSKIEAVGKFPNYAEVLREVLREALTDNAVESIGVDAKKLSDLHDALNYNGVKPEDLTLALNFDTPSKAILITVPVFDDSDMLGLLMPKMI